MNKMKYGLTVFVGIYLIYNITTQGVNSINSVIFGIYILSLGGELAVYLRKKKEAQPINEDAERTDEEDHVLK